MTYGMTNDVKIGEPRQVRRQSLPARARGRAGPVRRRQLPHARGPAASRNGRAVDGRHGDEVDHAEEARHVLAHRDFSAAASSRVEDVEGSPGFKDKVRLVFVSYGSRKLGGSGPVRVGNPHETTDALQKAGIKSVFYVSPNTAHEFLTWRRSLREFAPLLFRE